MRLFKKRVAGQPRAHWKLRRALKQMRLHVQTPPLSDYSIVNGEPLQKITIQTAYWIEMKPGVKVTKWHRLGRLKLIAELKGYVKFMAEQMKQHVLPTMMDNLKKPS